MLTDNPDIVGFNVTSPYKEAIIPYLDGLSPEAEKIGAVNCIVRRDGKLIGHNTDHYGFRVSLENFLRDCGMDVPASASGSEGDVAEISHEVLAPANSMNIKALVLGNGGAAKAVKYTLEEMAIPYRTVSSRGRQAHRHSDIGRPESSSRNERADYSGSEARMKCYCDEGRLECIGYDDLTPEMVAAHSLIINATPLGMYPDTQSAPPFPYEMLSPRHYLYDLVYNPPLTTFLKKGREAGATIKNGHEMLVLQAERSLLI